MAVKVERVSGARSRTGLGRLLAAFRRDRRGATMVMVAMAFIPMVGAMGLAIDSGRAILLKARLGDAIDAAGLAAAQNSNPERQQEDLNSFFAANFQESVGTVTLIGPTVVPNEENRTLTISASATMDTTLLRVLGIDTVTVSARTVVQYEDVGLELALVMDNTGSMRGGGKIGAMKTSAQILIDELFDGRETVEDLYVSLIPFSATVNIGAGRQAWLNDDTLFNGSGTSWKGCIEARYLNGNDMNDAPPSVELWDAFFYPSDTDNGWVFGDPGTIDEQNSSQNDGTGPNLGCGPAITSLTQNYQTITDAIAEMQPWHRGGTMNHMGIAWGWRTISPRWRGLWGGETPSEFPLDYDDPDMMKAIVILTDGENTFFNGNDHEIDGDGNYLDEDGEIIDRTESRWTRDRQSINSGTTESDYTGYGRSSEDRIASTRNGSNAELNTRTAELCRQLNETDVVVYTITFQVGSSTTRNLFRDCASDPSKYFDSPSNEELEEAFQRIAEELSDLRLAE